METSNGKIRADVAHDKLMALGYEDGGAPDPCGGARLRHATHFNAKGRIGSSGQGPLPHGVRASSRACPRTSEAHRFGTYPHHITDNTLAVGRHCRHRATCVPRSVRGGYASGVVRRLPRVFSITVWTKNKLRVKPRAMSADCVHAVAPKTRKRGTYRIVMTIHAEVGTLATR